MAQSRIDDREHEARADEGRVRRPFDGAVRHREADDVARAGGEDGVDADACDVRGVDRRPADTHFRIGGGEHVAPGAARAEASSRHDSRSQLRAAGGCTDARSSQNAATASRTVRTRQRYPVCGRRQHDRDAALRPAGHVERIEGRSVCGLEVGDFFEVPSRAGCGSPRAGISASTRSAPCCRSCPRSSAGCPTRTGSSRTPSSPAPTPRSAS